MIPAVVLSLSLPALAGAQFTFDSPVYDFKQVMQGKSVIHSFNFRNTGNAPGIISRVSSSCGCTVANVSEKVIRPGKTGSIRATFETSDYFGPVTKEVFVYLENQQKPAHTLTMKGVVVEELAITPRQINFGSLKAGVRAKVEATIENRGKQTLRIAGIKSALPEVKTSCGKRTLKPGEKSTFTVSITPRADKRFVSGYLTITTNSRAKPEKTVAIFGIVNK